MGIIFEVQLYSFVFRPYKIVTDVSGAANEKTFAQVMKEFSHTHIEFLKMDIEFSEFTVMPKIFDEISVSKIVTFSVMNFRTNVYQCVNS